MSLRRSFNVALFSAIGLSVLTHPPAKAADESARVIKTVGGTLTVAQSGPGQRLLLNKKPVERMEGSRRFVVEDDSVALKQVFRVGPDDVALVQTNCAGSACGGASTLWLVTVTPAGKVTVSDGMDADEQGNAELKMVGDQLVVTTTTVDGRRKKTNSWTYANGKIAKSK